jgi:RNA polymerase sigma-70 factor (ECF subfamily)
MTEPTPRPTNSADDFVSDAFVAQLMEHRHRIYAFIAKQLVNPADAEDVFQKTSIVLWRKMHNFDSAGSFFHWACGIAFNEVRNFLTVQRRSRLHFDAELVELLAEEAKSEGELSEARLSAMQHCMERLSARQQAILRRCYLGTSTITQVAEGIGRERGALYKQLARLKEKLIDCIRIRLAQEGVG